MTNILSGNFMMGFPDEESEEFIPVFPDEKDEDDSDNSWPDKIPVLPIRNTVLFPGVPLPITVSRRRSVKLVKKAYANDRIIGVLGQKNNKTEDPESEDLYGIGTVAQILKMYTLPDGNTTIIIQGRQKFEVETMLSDDPYFLAKVNYLQENRDVSAKESKAMMQSLKEAAFKILHLNPDVPQEAQSALENIESLRFLTHFLASNINADIHEKQQLLEISSVKTRAAKLLEFMYREIQLLEIKHEINHKAHSDIDQQQRDYFLRQQMKVLQDELGYDNSEQEIEALREKGSKKIWPEKIARHFVKEVEKLARMNPAAADYPQSMNYVEFLIDLPWDKYTKDNHDLKKARQILDRDHYGLDKAKERIIEYLAVLKLKQDMKGPILCLYGPPGVGKTSLGKSIAKALKRKYVRMSLGGLRDEAEIRGHRKTYVGAMPGKVLHHIKKAGTSNPVFVLDEIDKLGNDSRSDPSSAFLEVLDPEQNNTFADNYLEVEYDLSKVLFIATANSMDNIQPALRDRMEIIEINGYTPDEKINIAKRHLIPKLRKDHGLSAKEVTFTDAALQAVIEGYTRESGVRKLEQKLASVVRNTAKMVAMEEEYDKNVKPQQILEILGAPVFDQEDFADNKEAGVVTGLAWTAAGGEILSIEAGLYRGKGKLILSGQLGAVMKESAGAALSYLRTQADVLGIDYRVFDQYDLHVHVPAGAVPKDGPSAGITMLTALASVFTQRKVRPRLAMTGEITLRGRVLPVGGVKEKILAARRSGITDIIISVKNRKDIDEIDEIYLKDLNINFVKAASEVLEHALLEEKVQNPLVFQLDK